MKIGILADIHANHLALEAVLNRSKKEEVELLLIAGDLVGYYFEPLKVIQLLDPWDKVVIRGNHEEYLKNARANNDFRQEYEARYGRGLSEALEQLNDNQLNFLTTLPHPLEIKLDGKKILLCHGAPWDIDFYIYPDSSIDILSKCVIGSFDLVVLGHTHYPMLFSINNTLIVNPGSVGQPRNRKPGAHWAIYDTLSGKIEFKVEEYDCSELVVESKKRHPNLTYLSEVLIRQ